MTFYLKSGLVGAKQIVAPRLNIQLIMDETDLKNLEKVYLKNLEQGKIYDLFRDHPTMIDREYILQDLHMRYLTNIYYENDEIEFYTLYYSIKLKNDQIIGTIDLYGDSNLLELGIFIDSDYSGHNYATEAIMAIINFLKNNSSVTKLKWQCDTTNIASVRVAEKCGFVYDKCVDIYPGRPSYIFYMLL